MDDIKKYVNSCWATVAPNKVQRVSDQLADADLGSLARNIFQDPLRCSLALVLAELAKQQRNTAITPTPRTVQGQNFSRASLQGQTTVCAAVIGSAILL